MFCPFSAPALDIFILSRGLFSFKSHFELLQECCHVSARANNSIIPSWTNAPYNLSGNIHNFSLVAYFIQNLHL